MKNILKMIITLLWLLWLACIMSYRVVHLLLSHLTMDHSLNNMVQEDIVSMACDL